MKQVVLFGTNPSVIMAYYQLVEDENIKVVGFTVDKEYISEEILFALPVVSFEQVETVFPKENNAMFIPIGYSKMNALREQKYNEAKEKGYAFITYIHPTAILYPNVRIGENCHVGPYTVIQPGARIGDNVIIRENCHVGHDTGIGDHCFIAGHSNISGNVTIESNCFLGASCVIREGILLQRSSLIGAGVTMLAGSRENEVYMNRSTQKLPFPGTSIKL